MYCIYIYIHMCIMCFDHIYIYMYAYCNVLCLFSSFFFKKNTLLRSFNMFMLFFICIYIYIHISSYTCQDVWSMISYESYYIIWCLAWTISLSSSVGPPLADPIWMMAAAQWHRNRLISDIGTWQGMNCTCPRPRWSKDTVWCSSVGDDVLFL